MFSFIKKAGTGTTYDKDDKEKRKREKKEKREKQKRDRASLSTEEILRLDEVRKSLKIGRRKEKEKLPSGITADYTADFLASLERDDRTSYTIQESPTHPAHLQDGYTQSDSSETSLNSLNHPGQRSAPALPPKPPKRGILKTSKTSKAGENGTLDELDLADLARNTMQNELIEYQNLRNGGMNGKKVSEQLMVITSTSPSGDSFSDTTNSSFATPPFSMSPVGESQGFHRWNRTPNVEDLYLPLPSIAPLELPPPRTLTVPRQKPPRTDFGFSLRRAMVLERVPAGQDGINSVVNMRAVIFAEPGAVIQNVNETGLLPGDKLLEVNGVSVEDKMREDIIDKIKASGDFVTLKVQPVAELSELSRRSGHDGGEIVLDDSNIKGGTLRRSGSCRFKNSATAKSEEHLEKEKQWLEKEKLWFMHRAGFTLSTKIPDETVESGKVKLCLDQTGEILIVDEDDIEIANPPQFDRVEDLTHLRRLNESSILHTLRQRFAFNLIHTYASNSSLIVVNPMAPLAIYSEKVVSLFKGCKSEDMPPHIYSISQSSYHGLLSSRRDQSLLFLGRSGSGKTTNFRHAVQYLVTAAGSLNKVVTVEKLAALWTVLENFGNCKTVLNANATRFTQIFSLDYDQSGLVASATIQVMSLFKGYKSEDMPPHIYSLVDKLVILSTISLIEVISQILLLEKNRIVKRLDNETTFHIMQRLLCGVEGRLRKELLLDNLSGSDANHFVPPVLKHEDRQRAQAEFIKVCSSMNIMNITETEQKLIFAVLSAIYHLGCTGAVKAPSNNRYQFANPQAAQRACTLLGTTVEELSRLFFGTGSGGMVTPNAPRAPFRTPSPIDKGLDREAVGMEAIEGIIVGLYSELFNCIVHLLNRSLSATTHTVASVLLVDTPGFQNPATCGRQAGASFDDLCHNYLQERLQLLFHHTNLVAPKDRYAQEHVDVDFDATENGTDHANPTPLVGLLDRTAQNSVVRTSYADLHEADRRGLLWLLDEEAIYPGSNDETFIERLFTHYSDRDHQLLLRKAPGINQFMLHHLQGTNPVLYTAKGWLKCSRENPIARAATKVLLESCKEDLSKLFVNVKGLGGSAFSGSTLGIDDSQSLKRASSIRRTFGGNAAMKRKSVCLQTKFTIDGLIETLRRTKLRFVQCMLPCHDAACNDAGSNLLGVKNDGQGINELINVPLLRSQVRGAQILDSTRLNKQGFPNFIPLGEFRRRFRLLSGDSKPSGTVLDERKAVEDMLQTLDLELTSYRVGLSLTRYNMIKTQTLRQEDFAMSSGNPKVNALKQTPLPKPPPRNNVGLQKKPPASNLSVQNQYSPKCVTPSTPKQRDPKLDKALKGFDRIVQDFISAPSQEKISKIPKLQKSKTCCVIESRSVYKRTLSAPGHQSGELRKKTKSLLDLNKENDKKNNEVKNDNVGDVMLKFNILTSTPKQNSSNLDGYNHEALLHNRTFDFSSLSEEKNSSVSHSLRNDARNFEEIPPHRIVSRSTSTNSDYNEEKKNSISRIPVNTNLRKSFPSTPLGLNKLDQQIGSQLSERPDARMHSKFSKSVQNLSKSSRLSVPNSSNSNLSKENCELSKSVHNLSKSPSRMTLMHSSSLNVSRSRGSSSDLSRSVHNISKPPLRSSAPKSANTKLNTSLSKSVHNLTNNTLTLSNSQKLNRSKAVELSRSVNNLRKVSPKLSLPKSSNLSKSKNIEHSKSVQNLTKVSSKIAIAKSPSILSESAENLRKSSIDVSTKSEIFVQSKRDFVNTNVKTLNASPDFHKENVEAEIEEMKKVIEAKIDQQLKELSFEEIDGRIKGSVRSRVEQYSKNIEEEGQKAKDCFVALKCPKDIVITDIIEKFSGNDLVANRPVSLKNSATFKKKMSAFSNFIVDDEPLEKPMVKIPPKVTPRTKSGLKKSDVELVVAKPNEEVFGVKKHLVDSKYFENTKKLTHLGKNSPSKTPLELNLNNRSGGELPNAVSAKEKSLKNWLDDKKLGKRLDCNMNYGSDDSSSDDSGNISTEIENDDCVSPVDVPTEDLMVPASKTEVFLRNGVLTQLEAQRDECLGGVVVKLQARCRGYLARRRLSQRKLQDLAVRCIQRNVRKFMLVRDWPWWRLLVRVTPLLNVHRTEEKLKLKTEELESLKAKLEKLEQERSLLKHENDKLEAKMSEMTADLAEEHSAATLATERLDAETSERIRLERELSEVQTKNKELNRSSERLEMELLYARSDLNGISEEDDEDHDGENGGVYKQRFERVFRELEFTKRRLRQQHEDDLEQLVGLKKQLEKKLNDAYEEAEEQRQVVGQWKNKVQKLNGEMNDLKLLIEEQSSRNNLLEKKQRRFDSETQMLNDELKKEKNTKERTLREKEVLMAEKYSIETTLADTKLELELKEEKLNALQREYDEITCGERTEEEVTNLRRQKIEMERRLQDQEEELDELASQVQLLEQAKLRLEMTLESMRKEAKKETQLRDDELEEMRGNAQKRVKALEAQLENEHEERTLLLRQKHELERRLASAAESERHDRQGDEVMIRRLKNDLRKTKALLRDCQTQMDTQKADAPSKNVIRQLKNQLEDLECARALAVKSKQSLESELAETQSQLDESTRQRREAEERSNLLSREKAELQSQLEENEEELAEVFKKYKAAVQQMSLDQMALQEQVSLVSELEVERNQLKEQLTELTTKLESAEFMGDASSSLLAKRNEFKVKELESKLDLEQSTRGRLEVQISRLKESAEKLQAEISASKAREQQAHDQIRKLQRALREAREELNASVSRETDATQKRKELEKRLENLEAESAGDRNDLRLAKKRIEDLQVALQGELGDSVSDPSESDLGDSDCDSVDTYMPNHRSSSLDSKRFDNNLSRSSTTSSNLGKEASFS